LGPALRAGYGPKLDESFGTNSVQTTGSLRISKYISKSQAVSSFDFTKATINRTKQ